jgi:Tfp pilus assembly protein PilF
MTRTWPKGRVRGWLGYSFGVLLESGGDWKQARIALDWAGRFGDPEYAPKAWFSVGTLAAAHGQVDTATRAFRAAIESQHPVSAARAALNLGVMES